MDKSLIIYINLSLGSAFACMRVMLRWRNVQIVDRVDVDAERGKLTCVLKRGAFKSSSGTVLLVSKSP